MTILRSPLWYARIFLRCIVSLTNIYMRERLPNADPPIKKNKKGGSNENYSSFVVETVQESTPHPLYDHVTKPCNCTPHIYMTETNVAPKAPKGGQNKSGQRQTNQGNRNSSQGNGRPRFNNPNKFGTPSRYCSLCGLQSHTAAQGCLNMRDNNDVIVDVQPTQSTCSVCPPSVQPRLNHPAVICPYRIGGVFHGTNKWLAGSPMSNKESDSLTDPTTTARLK